jgi:hypothetical protein
LFPPGTSRTPQGVRDDPARYGELLVTPITLDHLKEVTRIDAMCEELPKDAKYIEKAVKESVAIQACPKEYQDKARKLHEKLQTEYTHLQEEKKQAKCATKVTPHNLDFQEAAVAPLPTYQICHPPLVDHNGCEVMATPKDNLAVENISWMNIKI